MNVRTMRGLMIAAAAVAMAGCDDGGVNSTPFVPGPTPTPTPTPSAPQGPVSASQSLEFGTFGDDVRIRFDSDSNRYEVLLPGRDWGVLTSDGASYAITDPGGVWNVTANFYGDGLDYTGVMVTNDGEDAYKVVYGIRTPASAVPVTGSATYAANLFGTGGDYLVAGIAEFDFNFASGSLSGFIDAAAEGSLGDYELGRYDFANTVYSTGSTSFSGDLSKGTLGGSFSGVFTGPLAQELMGQWKLPFTDPVDPGHTVSASGVLTGKRVP